MRLGYWISIVWWLRKRHEKQPKCTEFYRVSFFFFWESADFRGTASTTATSAVAVVVVVVVVVVPKPWRVMPIPATDKTKFQNGGRAVERDADWSARWNRPGKLGKTR